MPDLAQSLASRADHRKIISRYRPVRWGTSNITKSNCRSGDSAAAAAVILPAAANVCARKCATRRPTGPPGRLRTVATKVRIRTFVAYRLRNAPRLPPWRRGGVPRTGCQRGMHMHGQRGVRPYSCRVRRRITRAASLRVLAIFCSIADRLSGRSALIRTHWGRLRPDRPRQRAGRPAPSLSPAGSATRPIPLPGQ
jgi:hypothetical protein